MARTTQRDVMRDLNRRLDGDHDKVVAAYAAAERRGEVARASNVESELEPRGISGPWTFTHIADTDGRFADFTPYVASVSDRGLVAFQATLRDGSSGVYSGSGGPVSTVADSSSGLLTSVFSHPDINALGTVTVYATLKTGGRGVVRVRDGEITVAAMDAGPLGPTINDAGTVAFRTDETGPSGVFVTDGEEVRAIAKTGPVFGEFHGLPVINYRGTVVFRADLAAGGEGVYVGDGGPPIPIAETGDVFTGFGDFPTLTDDGTVAFCAQLRSGASGVFVAAEGSLATVIDTSGAFESFRGVLLDATGGVIFYATPKDGRLGVFSGPEPDRDRLIGLGEPFDGSTIVDFALNPVSMNAVGQIALRVKLADDRHLILRADRST